jgi:hypothetical protein
LIPQTVLFALQPALLDADSAKLGLKLDTESGEADLAWEITDKKYARAVASLDFGCRFCHLALGLLSVYHSSAHALALHERVA